jgi:hypothetical protein
MSANYVVECGTDGETLVAYGGLGLTFDTPAAVLPYGQWGIYRATAPAATLPDS